MTRSDRVSTLEEAKAQFETAWRQWLAWAKLRDDTQFLRRDRDARRPYPRAALGVSPPR